MIRVTIYIFKKYESLYLNKIIDTQKQCACGVNMT